MLYEVITLNISGVLMDLTDDINATLNAGSRKKGKKRIFILVLILMLAAAGAYFFLLSKGRPGGSPDAGMSFKTEPAAVIDIHVTVSATGTLEPTNRNNFV